MKFTFCLPFLPDVPVGGFNVVFEYANRLVDKGHEVSLVCFTNQKFRKVKNYTIKYYLSHIYKHFYPKWFPLDKRVKKIATPYRDETHFPDADVVFATAVNTAEIVHDLPKRCGRKYYLIQDFENWSFSDEDVYQTYQMGMTNIVVSQWLYDMVHPYDSEVKLLKNPIDTDAFSVTKPIEERNPLEIAMLYHYGEHKGIPVALEALELVRKRYPGLHVTMFGAREKREDIDKEWIDYHQNQTALQLRALYNEAAIFVCASVNEGFGLTGAESMACGCALVSTAYKGVFEYANDTNALLSPVNDPQALAANILRAIEDADLRYALARKGSEDLKGFSLERAVAILIELME